MKNFRGILFLWLLSLIPATAQLTFDSREQTLEKKSPEEKADVTFPFRNETNHVIEIQSVKSSCGCTTAALKKTSYKPGESGEINATFKFGQRTGRQVKYITIAYASPKDLPEDRLKLEVTIVPPIRIQPTLVFWKSNSEPVTRSISLQLDPDLHLEIGGVSASNDDFRTKLSALNNDHYELNVTPNTTEGRHSAVFTIEAISKDGKVKHTVPVYARIQ
jgi:hypothetical protein